MSTLTPPSTADAGALAERVFDASNATMELASIHLGHRLGLYHALDEPGPATAAELARRTGTDTRYVREWLEQQAVAGILECANPDAGADDRRFAIPAGHEKALLDPESLTGVEGLTRLIMGLLSTLPRVVDAFRSGEGIPYAGYGEDTREGVAATSRPMYAQQLGSHWLPTLADIHARLSTPPSAHIADIACGGGWSSINIARAYPLARVDGIDEDAASIDQARRNAAETGMQERVRFIRHDASDPSLTGTYDLITIFEAVHDMARPAEALRTARGLLAPGGCVLVADEKVHDRFTVGDQDPVERWMYGFSVLHCLPVSRADTPSAATGTVMRTHTMRAYAQQAGFRDVEIVPIEHDFWRFYRLNP
jgi:ubiquinone/menaquinone biosynthesis C-methylase UbiE